MSKARAEQTHCLLRQNKSGVRRTEIPSLHHDSWDRFGPKFHELPGFDPCQITISSEPPWCAQLACAWFRCVQGDTSPWFKPPVDIKTKVPYWPALLARPKQNFCFDVNGRFESRRCVTLYASLMPTSLHPSIPLPPSLSLPEDIYRVTHHIRQNLLLTLI